MEVRKTILFGLAALLGGCWETEADIVIKFERKTLKDENTKIYCLPNSDSCYTREGALEYVDRVLRRK